MLHTPAAFPLFVCRLLQPHWRHQSFRNTACNKQFKQMADPLTIIGGIAAILDLISFGYKVVSVAAELKDSPGELEVNSEQSVIVQDIEAIVGDLRPRDGAEQDDFEPLRQKALVIATELKTALDKLKLDGKHSAWKAMKVAIRNVWDREKLQKLEQRLRGLTLELNTRLTANSR
jgi:hypothetical protein